MGSGRLHCSATAALGWQLLDASVKRGVAVVEGTHLAEQFKVAVGVVACVAIEEMKLLHNLVV